MSHKLQLSLPPLWREAGVGLEAATLLRDPVFREGPPGSGSAMLIPGFLAGDGSLALMTQWLRKSGYRTKSAGMRANVGCSGDGLARITERLETHVEQRGPAVIIGQSRGGHAARALAVTRPDLVKGIVTLGSPLLNPFAVHPLILLQVGAVGALGTLGIKGLLRNSCRNGDCCEDFWATQSAPIPAGVGFVSVFSRHDGVVNWRSCLDPYADHVEVDASHCGMAAHAGTYRAIAAALDGFRDEGPLAGPLAQAA